MSNTPGLDSMANPPHPGQPQFSTMSARHPPRPGRLPVDPSGRSYGTLQSTRTDIYTEDDLAAVRRNRTAIRMVIYFLCSVVAIAAFILVAGCIWFYTSLACLGTLNPPYPTLKSWDDFKNQSFVVGFDLTAGYG